ncbi:MAG: TRAP transporter substrate-binding protein DctP [Planctomycetota bacterium]
MTAIGRMTLWILLAALLCAPTESRKVRIKLATLAPDGSAWHELLKDLKADWTRISGGRVQLRIYPGGIAGDEPTVMRKMGVGTYQAALITSIGLSSLDRSTRLFIVPRMLRTNEELDQAVEAFAPEMERTLAGKGTVVLSWLDAGWVRFFVPEEEASVDAVRKMKLFTWAGDTEAIALWKASGFHVVPLPATDLVTGLKTDLINAFGTTPVYALSSQTFRHTRYMIDMNWAPLTGALVITSKAWSKIPEDLRPQLKAAVHSFGERFKSESRRLEAEAIVAMEKRGLKVIVPTSEEVARWDAVAKEAYPSVRGSYVPADDFDRLAALVSRLRSE